MNPLEVVGVFLFVFIWDRVIQSHLSSTLSTPLQNQIIHLGYNLYIALSKVHFFQAQNGINITMLWEEVDETQLTLAWRSISLCFDVVYVCLLMPKHSGGHYCDQCINCFSRLQHWSGNPNIITFTQHTTNLLSK